MKPARLYLGVDGGQSSTTAVIGDESGNPIGAGIGGPCNHVGVAEGPATLKRAVLECLGKACHVAGLDPDIVVFEGACFGMSGGPADKRALLTEIVSASHLEVTDDAVIALSGALGGKPGVVTIAGTGSMAFGKDAEGRTVRAGGWGYVFGDEGGAFDIARQAVRAALQEEEGWGPATLLKDALLRRTGMASANDVLHAFYTTDWPRSRVAALAPMVDEIAVAGDAVAAGILQQAGRELATISLAVRSQLRTDHFSWTGGAFRSELLLSSFCGEINRQQGCVTSRPSLSAAAGALLIAYQIAGVWPDLDKLLTSRFLEHAETFHSGSSTTG